MRPTVDPGGDPGITMPADVSTLIIGYPNDNAATRHNRVDDPDGRVHVKLAIVAVAAALSASTACAQEPDTLGYIRIVGDTITVIKPPNTGDLPTTGLPDYALPVALADTLRLLMRGDSAVTLSPVPGIPVGVAVVQQLLIAARFEAKQQRRKP